jgi:hypothetical protein
MGEIEPLPVDRFSFFLSEKGNLRLLRHNCGADGRDARRRASKQLAGACVIPYGAGAGLRKSDEGNRLLQPWRR